MLCNNVHSQILCSSKGITSTNNCSLIIRQVDGWLGLGWSVPVWIQNDEHCNLIQIKTADFFFCPWCLTLLFHHKSHRRWLIAVVDYGVWSKTHLMCSFKMCELFSFVSRSNEQNFKYHDVHFFSFSNVNNTLTTGEKVRECMLSLVQGSSAAFIILPQRLCSHSWCLHNRLPVLTLSPSVSLPLPHF